MQFTKDVKEFDAGGNETKVPVAYRAELNNGIAEVFLEKDDQSISVCLQPWRPEDDGSRANWTSINEVVEWFKQRA